AVTHRTQWRAYEFKGKPGDPSRRPPQIAPYHLRLDWLMWFAAMSTHSQHPWFIPFMARPLDSDRGILGLLRSNPFPDAPPGWIRAPLYAYRLGTAWGRGATGHWWTGREIGPYMPPSRLHAREQPARPAGVGEPFVGARG